MSSIARLVRLAFARGRRSGWGLLLCAGLLVAGPVRAQHEVPVDLELVLLVDVSGSVDAQEAELQRQGYARALTNPAVLEAIRSGSLGRIAVTYVEWADDTFQNVVVGWTILDGQASAEAFAGQLLAAPITTAFWTSIGTAIDFAARQFDGNGVESARRVIDISGDGYSNRGRTPKEARDQAVAAGVVINGLPILNRRPNPWGGVPPMDLDAYYRENVIGGPGAFVQVAEDFASFGEAILSKLVKEIAMGPAPDGTTPRSLAAIGGSETRADAEVRGGVPGSAARAIP